MISIVITTYNRPNQLRRILESIAHQGRFEVVIVDDGTDVETRVVCELGARPARRLIRSSNWLTYLKLERPNTAFRNPAYPNNVGITHSKGDIILLQNAEFYHVDTNTVAKLTNAVSDNNAVFARVTSLLPDGTKGDLYCGKENPRPYFFCGAIKRAWFEKLRGFDEDYTGAGFDDDDFADRLRASGVSFEFSDVEVHHQWHPPVLGMADFAPMQALYNKKKADMEAGSIGVVRNLGKDWGR